MANLFDSPWKIMIVAVVIIVLFGSRKLPDAARSLGKSMRILKTEVSSMHDDDDDDLEPRPPAHWSSAPAQIQAPAAPAAGRAGADRRAEQAAERPAAVGRQRSGRAAGQVAPPPPNREGESEQAWRGSPAPSRAPASWASSTCARSDGRTRRGACPCWSTCPSCATGCSRARPSSWAGRRRWSFSNQIWAFVSGPSARRFGHCRMPSGGHQLVFNGVFEGFFIQIKIAFFVGLIVSSPSGCTSSGRSSPRALLPREEVGLPVHRHRRPAVRPRRATWPTW